MTNHDKKLFEISCKEMLMEIVKESHIINNQLTFSQKILLFDKIKEMSLNEIVPLLFQEVREIESKDQRDTKYGAAITAAAIAAKSVNAPLMAGAAIGAGSMFLYRKLTDPCFYKTLHIISPTKKKMAQLNCKMSAIEKVISKMRSDMERCSQAANPGRCEDKIAFEIQKWRNKYEDHLVRINKLRKS